MTIHLVVGAAGWLGSRIVEALSRDPEARVLATWHRQVADSADRANVRTVRLDIADADAVARIVAQERPTVVIHAAAAISTSTTADAVGMMTSANLIGTANLVRSSREHGVRRFVFCSSVGVYGDESPAGGFTEDLPTRPTTPYGMSKVAGELLLQEAVAGSAMEGIALRLGGIHGAGRNSGAIAGFARQAMRNEPLRVSSPQLVFNYLFIDDAARAVEMAARRPVCRPFSSYNVAGDTPMSVEDLARTIVCKTGSSSTVEIAEPRCPKYRVLATGQFEREMGFTPERFEEALEMYLRGVQARGAAW
ncbi:MAG: NAD(P)-dependent oxidoreductase [Rhodocyclales bacterium]|nr:NAD(P)-dependent oxidoreductase [Rhodocyclales bacterium]